MKNEADKCFRMNRYMSWVPIADLRWHVVRDRRSESRLGPFQLNRGPEADPALAGLLRS